MLLLLFFGFGHTNSFANLLLLHAANIPAMRFTDNPSPECGAWPMGTLQVFSVKVAGIRGGLHWPFDVFGMISVRDNVDFNRNTVFNRARDNCQTLTKEVSVISYF